MNIFTQKFTLLMHHGVQVQGNVFIMAICVTMTDHPDLVEHILNPNLSKDVLNGKAAVNKNTGQVIWKKWGQFCLHFIQWKLLS